MTDFTERELNSQSITKGSVPSQTVTKCGKPTAKPLTPRELSIQAIAKDTGVSVNTLTKRSLSPQTINKIYAPTPRALDKGACDPADQEVAERSDIPPTTFTEFQWHPELAYDPEASPSIYSCAITWETDTAAYHRVRYKKPGGEWQYSEWSTAKTVFAGVTVSGLDPNNTKYIYDIQSGYVGKGIRAFDFYPGDDSNTFNTLYNYPSIVGGITATPAFTSCVVDWETDIVAYHRVRYKKPGDSWTTTDWSASKTTIAAVTLTPLEGQHIEYIYDVQSCDVGDGSAAFDFTPGDDTSSFFTLCNTPFVFSDFDVTLYKIGTTTHLKFWWKADNATGYEKTEKLVKWLLIGSSWRYLGWYATSGTSFTIQDDAWSIGTGDYKWYARNKDVCGNNEISEEQTFTAYRDPITKELYIVMT